MSTFLRRSASTSLACLAVGTMLAAAGGQRDTRNSQDAKEDKDEEARRPKLTLKAQPPVSVSPARVVLTAELVGGANDYEEFYCPTIEWDWGDETTSESTFDCRPYEAGKSEIRRRFTVDHRFRRPGSIKVSFRLKRNDKALATASVTIQVQPGVGGND
ncbi:MAG: hypothetical protein A3G76_02970 [Acidobacteria bacterium RIFCSPLOWO2_12_FULL_65_11]|nr:MAG: hypothetical protein A3H95_18330 [Acidobacteria bacterium RIFCSPLOWO2_02_FULL_64_15]OFW30325.1 MAG: hypothetical protein A3G76_02970 [Acidobacteria bacterium RIFCSPLOWO2_12_FULL_65_11]